MLGSVIGGPYFGLFALGIFFRRANSKVIIIHEHLFRIKTFSIIYRVIKNTAIIGGPVLQKHSIIERLKY